MSKKSDLVRGFGLAMSIGAALDEIRRELGVSEEAFHVLGTQGGRPHLEKMVAGLMNPSDKTLGPPVYLERLYRNEKIVLGPTDGTRTIAQAKDVFTGGIDSDFVDWGLDVPAKPTEAMECVVSEHVNGDVTFAEVFGGVGHSLEQFCHTQHQIIDFCVTHRDKPHQDGYGTFFLFQVGEKFFIACVSVDANGRLCAGVNRFLHNRVWHAGYRDRFVVLQLVLVTA